MLLSLNCLVGLGQGSQDLGLGLREANMVVAMVCLFVNGIMAGGPVHGFCDRTIFVC